MVIGRFVLTTSTGSIQLWQYDRLQWIREEALSEIDVAQLVELPEKQAVLAHGVADGETFPERMLRQLSDARVREEGIIYLPS